MSKTVSPSSNRNYGLARVAAVWKVPRSTIYARRDAAARDAAKPLPRKPGPKRMSDEELLGEILQVIAGCRFHGEGYRKVFARLRHKGIRAWKERVLRLMRENGLLSPSRIPAARREHPHEGTIIASVPDEVWGTDATAAFTLNDGKVAVFAAIDHCTAECVGIHVSKRGHRFEALEPIRQAVAARCGGFRQNAALGLILRHDNGSAYTSDAFQGELDFLGFQSSPSYVRQPEGNGCVERFFRTLKEQLLWIQDFENLEDLRAALAGFRDDYNNKWILQRLGYKTPAQARSQFSLDQALAA
jgi:putative transposase